MWVWSPLYMSSPLFWSITLVQWTTKVIRYSWLSITSIALLSLNAGSTHAPTRASLLGGYPNFPDPSLSTANKYHRHAIAFLRWPLGYQYQSKFHSMICPPFYHHSGHAWGHQQLFRIGPWAKLVLGLWEQKQWKSPGDIGFSLRMVKSSNSQEG